MKGVADAETRKALAFAIFIKQNNETSVVKGWSYKELAAISELSINTCRKRVAKLREMNLVAEFHRGATNYLKFRCLRHPAVKTQQGNTRRFDFLDADISRLDFSSVKTIELGLRAMVIYEIQKQKDWYGQVAFRGRMPKGVARLIRKKLRGRGLQTISDNGLSYTTIAKRTGASRNTVTTIIEHGERLLLFRKAKQERRQVYAGYGLGARAAESVACSYSTLSNLYIQPANKFRLCLNP